MWWSARTMRELGYEVVEGPERAVTGGAADSRKVRPGDLFTAFPGENTDGNLFVAPAVASGAVAIICSRTPDAFASDATIVVAPNTNRALGQLANAWRKSCNPHLAGITGTVGMRANVNLPFLADRRLC